MHHDFLPLDVQLAQGCRAQLEQGLFKPVDRIRAHRYPVAKEGTTLKMEVEYPNSRGKLALFRISAGEIRCIESLSVFQP